MSSFEHEAALEQHFERALIESARADAPPAGAKDAAWDRFAAALAATAGVADADGPRAAAAADGGRLAAHGSALKWLVIGAIGGSALTAAVMATQRPPSVALPAAQQATPRSLPAAPPSDRSPSAVSVGPAAHAPAVIAPPGAPVANPRARSRPADHVLRPVAAPAANSHAAALAAEVALLDSALRANAAGAYRDALRIIDDYRRRFPTGELGIDADVIALDALAAEHEDDRVATDAARFLSRYPNDPHAAHVRALIDEPSR
jgi:hypothetical protein